MNKTRMNSTPFRVILLLCAASTAYTARVGYLLRHPQEQFCSADFAVRAEVLPKNQSRDGHNKDNCFEYDLKIWEIYKGEEKLHNSTVMRVNNSGETGLFAKACCIDVRLTTSTVYFLAGNIRQGKIQLNLGSWVQQWSEVTAEQRAGIKRFYGQNCECQITPCFVKDGCVQPLKGCDVPAVQLREFYLQRCEWRYSYCLKNRETTACSWQETAEYKNCKNNTLP